MHDFETEDLVLIANHTATQFDQEALAFPGGYGGMLAELQRGAERHANGVDTVTLTGRKGEPYSQKEMIVLVSALGIKPSYMVRTAEYLRLLAINLGQVDEDGLPLPMAVVGAPSSAMGARFEDKDWRHLKSGDLGVFGRPQLAALKSRLRGFNDHINLRLISYSLGSAIAPSLVKAIIDENESGHGPYLTVDSMDQGAWPNLEVGRTLRSYFSSFMKSAATGKYPPGTPGIFTFGDSGRVGFFSDLIGDSKIQLATLSAVTRQPDPMDDMRRIAATFSRLRLGVGYSDNDVVARPAPTEDALAVLHGVFGDRLAALKLHGSDHSWARDIARKLGVVAGAGLRGLQPLARPTTEPARPPHGLAVVRAPRLAS